jgi:hypothetical protein
LLATQLSLFLVSQTGDKCDIQVIQTVVMMTRVPGFADWPQMCEVSWTNLEAWSAGVALTNGGNRRQADTFL